jgi:hypothetical protein
VYSGKDQRALKVALQQLAIRTLLRAILTSHFLVLTYLILYMLMLLIITFRHTVLSKTFESVRDTPTNEQLHGLANGILVPSTKVKININVIRDSEAQLLNIFWETGDWTGDVNWYDLPNRASLSIIPDFASTAAGSTSSFHFFCHSIKSC